jgi:hypothetical protein
MGRGSKEKGEGLGGDEDGGGEGGVSARVGRERGSIGSGGTEGDVAGNNRKDMSSTEKAEEEGRG